MWKFHDKMAAAHQGNAFGVPAFDHGMRCALTFLLTGQPIKPTVPDAGMACIYVRDRVCVPRDMTIWAAKYFRWCLTETAKLTTIDPERIRKIIEEKRYDQMPEPFVGDVQIRPAGLKMNFQAGGLAA